MIQSNGNTDVISEVRIYALESIVKDKADMKNPPKPDHHNNTKDSISEHKLIETLMSPSTKATVKANVTPM